MKAIGPLVGYVMRETKGRADGGEVTRLIRERLGRVQLSYSVRRRGRTRTTRPAPSRVPPPATSRTTSSPVNGRVPAELEFAPVPEPDPVETLLLPTDEQVCGL